MTTLSPLDLENALDPVSLKIKDTHTEVSFTDDRYGLNMGITPTEDFLQIYVHCNNFDVSRKFLYVWSQEDTLDTTNDAQILDFIDAMETKYGGDSSGGIFFRDVTAPTNPSETEIYDDNSGFVLEVPDGNGMIYHLDNVDYFTTLGKKHGMYLPTMEMKDVNYHLLEHDDNNHGLDIIRDQFKSQDPAKVSGTRVKLWRYEFKDKNNSNLDLGAMMLRLQWYKPGRYAVAFVVHHPRLKVDKSYSEAELTQPTQGYPAYFRLFTGQTTMTVDVDGTVNALATVAMQSSDISLIEQQERNVTHFGLRLFSSRESNRVDEGVESEVLYINDIEERKNDGELLHYFIDSSGLRNNLMRGTTLFDDDYQPINLDSSGAEEWWDAMSVTKITPSSDLGYDGSGLYVSFDGSGFINTRNLIDRDYEPNTVNLPNERNYISHFLPTEEIDKNLDAQNFYQLNFINSTDGSGVELSMYGMLVFEGVSYDMANIWEGAKIEMLFDGDGAGGYNNIRFDVLNTSEDWTTVDRLHFILSKPKTWTWIRNENDPYLGTNIRHLTAFLLTPSTEENNTVDPNNPYLKLKFTYPDNIMNITGISWNLKWSTISSRTTSGRNGERTVNSRSETITQEGRVKTKVGRYQRLENGRLLNLLTQKETTDEEVSFLDSVSYFKMPAVPTLTDFVMLLWNYVLYLLNVIWSLISGR